MSRAGLLSLVACLSLVSAGGESTHTAMTPEEKHRMRDQVMEMFSHAYNSYMDHAYPADELMPLSCKGRVRGVDPSRGDVDDALGKFSLTLIDTLDTLAVLGELDEFEKAVKLVIKDVTFDNDVVVSVFETNIRVLGGLLGGHFALLVLKNSGKGMQWYRGELLDMAKEIGYRLLPAFNTSTGIPYPRVNLKYGIHHPSSGTGSESDTCTACAGTMIMEFGALSRLTGDPIFEEKAQKAMEAIWVYRSRASDLVGTVINIHNGDWVRRDSGVGAGIDSYYEYCLKAYILLGDDTYLERFNKHYKSIMHYMNRGPLFLSVQMHQPDRTAHGYMDALQAFWPGLQVLKGDLRKAIETHQMLYEVSKKHTFLPEAFTTDFEVHWGQHPLRPELVESTYFLFEATNDPYYLEVGKHIVEKINEHARVPCGFAALRDVRTLSHEDRMDSFVLAETFKYLYLLFSEKSEHVFNMNQFIFTTEAHLLPLSLSTMAVNGSASQELKYNLTLNPENEHEYTCPFTRHTEGSSIKYAEEVRRKSRTTAQGSCPNKKTFSFTSDKPPRLRAEQFVPGNQQHVETLKAMGIVVVQMKDGRIQLMQTASTALSQEHAEDGIKFMQEMIELAKQRNDESGVAQNPRVVQLMSAPYMGDVILNAGPAQFGLDLGRGDVGMGAEVAVAEPIKGCSSLENAEELKHRIAIMERGECMFIDKARQAEAVGAVGVVIIDNNEGSSSDSQPIFAMAGDGSSNDVKIPAVLLFSKEGRILRNAIAALEDSNRRLTVRLAAKATGTDRTATPVRVKHGESSNTDKSEGMNSETKYTSGESPQDSELDKVGVNSWESPSDQASSSNSNTSTSGEKQLSQDSANNREGSTQATAGTHSRVSSVNNEPLLDSASNKHENTLATTGADSSVASGSDTVDERKGLFCASTGKPCSEKLPHQTTPDIASHVDTSGDQSVVSETQRSLQDCTTEVTESKTTKKSQSSNIYPTDDHKHEVAGASFNENSKSESSLQGDEDTRTHSLPLLERESQKSATECTDQGYRDETTRDPGDSEHSNGRT